MLYKHVWQTRNHDKKKKLKRRAARDTREQPDTAEQRFHKMSLLLFSFGWECNDPFHGFDVFIT